MADRYPYQAEAVGARDSRGGARGAESDPLAELARLIGQTDPNAFAGRGGAAQPQRANYQDRAHQPEPQHYEPPQYQQQYEPQHYEEQHAEPVEQEPATPSWMRAASNWQQPQPSPQQQAPAVHHTAHEQAYHPQEQEEYTDTPSFLRTARQHDPSRYDEVLYDQNSQNMAQPQYADGQHYQDGYQDQTDPNGYPPFYADGAEEEQPRRKRGGLMTVAAVLVLAVVGTAGAYGYRSYTGVTRTGEPPVIKAEPGANKIVPPTQTTDASGKIVDRIGGSGNGQERVLSREEQPIDINGRNAPRVVFPPTNVNPNPPALAATAQQGLPQQAAAQNGALGDEPRRIRTVPVRPDQPDVVPQQANQQQRAATQARAQAPAPGNGPVSLAPGATPARAQTAAATPAPAPSRSGGYMVQISSQRSEADAQASYQAMQSKFPNVLGSHQASIRRADLGEKGVYYRALVGPFAAAEDAGQLCNSLKSAGGQCVVQRN